jgi:acyl dehydratase
MIEVSDPATLRDRIGQEVAVSDWLLINQDRINQFAEATEDRQWIHVDAERARAESPFKTTIAHGYLTLALTSRMVRMALSFSNLKLAINYGLNKVRFITPVPAGSRVRGRLTPLSVEDAGGGATQVVWNIVVEREGADRPCCVAEWVVRYYRA